MARDSCLARVTTDVAIGGAVGGTIGIIARDGVIGLYRGFVPNALKNLPNSSIRLTTFDAAKALIQASSDKLEKIRNANREFMEDI